MHGPRLSCLGLRAAARQPVEWQGIMSGAAASAPSRAVSSWAAARPARFGEPWRACSCSVALRCGTMGRRHFAAEASEGEQAVVAPRVRPHPVSMRFALSNRPFFPIWRNNLRDAYKKKKAKKMGAGRRGKGGTRLRHFQAKRKKSKTWEHGATPLFKRIPRWPAAHKHMTRKKLEPLNLSKLRMFIEKGRLDTRYPITQRHLYESRCVPKLRRGVYLFNVNDFPFPYKIDIEVASADQSSIDMIRAVGGSVTVVYMEAVSLRAHVKPWKYEVLPRTARPTLKMVTYMEKMKARGAVARYIKPLWLIEEERRLQTQLRELQGEEGLALAERLARGSNDRAKL